jgi:Novel toxin 16
MVNAANLDMPPNRVMWDAPPSSEALDFANTMASVAANQNSGPPIRLAQAATPVAPSGAGPLPIVPGIMPGSFENGEWTKNAVNGLVGLSNWMGGLFHSSPASSEDPSKSGYELNQAQAGAVDPARVQQLAKARQQWSTGQKITPPGFCHDEEYNRLNAAVDRACNSAQACSPVDSPQTLHAKAFAFKQCALARSEREEQCFKGGDGGHREQIRNFWRGHDTCQTFLGLTP